MSQNGSAHIFQDAKDPTINGGMFNAVGGNMNIYESERTGMKLLMENISPGAFHNSAERSDPPQCHSGTRTEILRQIMTWIRAPEHQRKLIIWLYGPAGGGKTAIEQTIADLCKKEGRLAASFFFGSTAAGRNDASRFVATITYQLLDSFPEIRNALLETIKKDPTIFSLSLKDQMQRLVVAPLSAVKPRQPMTFLVDGVDECGPDGRTQMNLLNVIGAVVDQLRHIPITLLVASRSEYEIREAFDQEPLTSLTQKLPLDSKYKPEDDICFYLKGKLSEVQQKQRKLGTKFPSPWPSEADINTLVRKSSGQFIFAATVVKFIDSPRHDPTDRLNIILGMASGGSESPFATIDILYSFVLSRVHDLPKVLQVLTLLILGASYSDILTQEVVSHLLGYDVQRVLMDMHALLFVPPPDSKSVLFMHHASFHDFLMDKSRSGNYYIDVGQGHSILSQRWLDTISQSPVYQNPLNLRTSIQQFTFHFREGSNTTIISDRLEKLSIRAVLERIDKWKDLYGDHWESFFAIAETQGGADVLSRFEDELYAFFLDRLHQYPEFWRPLIPALFCFPDHDVASLCFKNLIKNSTNGMAMDSSNSIPRLLMLCDPVRSNLFFFEFLGFLERRHRQNFSMIS